MFVVIFVILQVEERQKVPAEGVQKRKKRGEVVREVGCVCVSSKASLS